MGASEEVESSEIGGMVSSYKVISVEGLFVRTGS